MNTHVPAGLFRNHCIPSGSLMALVKVGIAVVSDTRVLGVKSNSSLQCAKATPAHSIHCNGQLYSGTCTDCSAGYLCSQELLCLRRMFLLWGFCMNRTLSVDP